MTTAGVWFAGILAACAFVGPASPLPRTIQIGAFPESLRPLLAQDCVRTTERQYEGAQAAPFTRQLQINCSDLQVFGAPREVEFLFNDGPLGHVWILVRGEELGELRGQLERVFGPVVHETGLDLVFASGTVALRNRPPEVLVATPALVSDITGWSQAPQGKRQGER